MSEDPIVADIRRIRDSHAAKFNYDLEKIMADLIQRQKKSGKNLIRFSPKPARKPVSRA